MIGKKNWLSIRNIRDNIIGGNIRDIVIWKGIASMGGKVLKRIAIIKRIDIYLI
jgi:hypothetical protein